MRTELPAGAGHSQAESSVLFSVRGLCKQYARGGLWRKRVQVTAAENVTFDIARGKTLALVGGSGSGKSTVARCVALLEKPDTGEIFITGTNVARLPVSKIRHLQGKIQMVFQDAATAMNARFSAFEVVEEPLRIRRAPRDPKERREVIRGLMTEVGLSPDWIDRPILQFSGGQQQRLALARSLVLRPELLVLDEALSGLDLATQARIANLLLELQAKYALTYLLISHDLALVSRLADSVGVMSHGRCVEVGATEQVITNPQHDETRKLLASARTAAANLTALMGMP